VTQERFESRGLIARHRGGKLAILKGGIVTIEAYDDVTCSRRIGHAASGQGPGLNQRLKQRGILDRDKITFAVIKLRSDQSLHPLASLSSALTIKISARRWRLPRRGRGAMGLQSPARD
jgi:hypothetical protein